MKRYTKHGVRNHYCVNFIFLSPSLSTSLLPTSLSFLSFSLFILSCSLLFLFASLPPIDCPQVQAVYDYAAQQHDELELMRGDIVKVYRKMADGKCMVVNIV